MSTIQQHLAELKNFKPANVSKENKLYFLEVEEKPGMVKVGDTTRSVKLRNQETMTNASLHRKEGTKPTWVVAKKWNNKSYRDKQFHSFLRKKGYKFDVNNQDHDSEWVIDVTVEQLFAELAEFTQKPEHQEVELRTAQQYALHLLDQATNDEEHHFINFGACVRIGKTIISLTHAARNDAMPVYIGKNLSSQYSADKDNQKFGIVPDMLTQSLHGVDEFADDALSKKSKKIIRNINKVNTDNKLIIFYIDEVDDSSHTQKSRDIINPVVEYYSNKDMLFQVIPMSGTRIHRGEKILKDLTDDEFKEISIEYYEMQILQPETTCNRNYRHISFYSDSDIGLVNISDSMKNTDAGHKSMATVIEKLLGTNNFDFTTNPDFPHWFMKFDTVGKDNASKLATFLNRNYSIIENQEFHYQKINGDVTTSKKAEVFCKNIINKHQDKTCVFITQGMATTSFSVTEIGNSAVFSDNELTADDTQALHRSATWTEGKDDCNMIVITTNDSQEFTFDDIFEDETKNAKTRNEKRAIYKELLNNNSMVHFTYNGSACPVKITHDNVDDMLDKKAQAMTREASITSHIFNDLDEDILDSILLSYTGKKQTSLRSKSTKGDSFDPFGNGTKKSKKSINIHTMTPTKKQQIIREFVNNAVNVPAVAREQDITMEDFAYWAEVNVSKELFFDVYDNLWSFKDRIDTIYNLCTDDNYLIKNYISKLAV